MVELSVAATGGSGLKIIDKSYTATPNTVLTMGGEVVCEVNPGSCFAEIVVKNTNTTTNVNFYVIVEYLDSTGDTLAYQSMLFTASAGATYTVHINREMQRVRFKVIAVVNTEDLVLESVSVSAFELMG